MLDDSGGGGGGGSGGNGGDSGRGFFGLADAAGATATDAGQAPGQRDQVSPSTAGGPSALGGATANGLAGSGSNSLPGSRQGGVGGAGARADGYPLRGTSAAHELAGEQAHEQTPAVRAPAGASGWNAPSAFGAALNRAGDPLTFAPAHGASVFFFAAGVLLLVALPAELLQSTIRENYRASRDGSEPFATGSVRS